MGGLRDAVRMLARHPGLSTTTVAALAMGIGCTAIMFSIAHAVLHRDLPVEDGDRIVRVALAAPSPGIPGAEPTIHDYLDWRAAQQSFEELAAYREGSVNVRGPAGPVRYSRTGSVQQCRADRQRLGGAAPGARDRPVVPGS